MHIEDVRQGTAVHRHICPQASALFTAAYAQVVKLALESLKERLGQ
jgi:hypothetical protein